MSIQRIILTVSVTAMILTMAACSTVRDTTDWIPGVDSNEEIKAEQKKQALESIAKERQVYKDKVAFAATARSTSESDAKISVNISQKYTTMKSINRENIGIEVNAGVVTLTGNVHSNDSAIKVISLAKNTVGVSRVISRLVVINVRAADKNNQ